MKYVKFSYSKSSYSERNVYFIAVIAWIKYGEGQWKEEKRADRGWLKRKRARERENHKEVKWRMRKRKKYIYIYTREKERDKGKWIIKK